MAGRQSQRRGGRPPADGAAHDVQAPATRQAVAQVRVTLYGTDEGEAEVEVAIDPAGPFGAAHADGDARVDAYERLYETVQRELGEALAVLGDEDGDGDIPSS